MSEVASEVLWGIERVPSLLGNNCRPFDQENSFFPKNKINVDAFIKPIYTLIKSNIDKLDM